MIISAGIRGAILGSGAQSDAGFAKALPGFGVDFKTAVKKRYPALAALHPYGEVLPRAENRVLVDEKHLDRYGVPVSRNTGRV